MTLVQKIEALCKESGTTITALERECKLSLGSIRKWDDHAPSLSKVTSVAKALGVTVAYLVGESDEKTPTKAGERIPYENYREVLAGTGIRILLDADAKLTQDQLDDIVEFIEFQQRKNGR